MDPFVITGIGLLCFFCAVLAGIFWEAWRSGKMIQEWADEHGYTILGKKQPLVNLGPFRWENPRGRTFYHITVCSRDGQIHRGWISGGVEYLGLFVNRVEIRWDADEPPDVSVPIAPGTTVWLPPPVE